jgi:SpoIID/LytB domain protein
MPPPPGDVHRAPVGTRPEARVEEAPDVSVEALDLAAWVVRRASTGAPLASHNVAHLDTPVLPGSLYKVVLARAAIEQGIADLSVACPRRLTAHGRVLDCVHPAAIGPLELAQALAYSCNTYFARLASRLDAHQWARTAKRLGAPPPATDAPAVLVGLGLAGTRLTATAWRDVVRAAILDGEGADRTVIQDGLRAAVTSGSADVLRDAWHDTLAKTGTVSTSVGSEGLVVVFRPEDDLEVVVRVNGGSGRDAAAVARALLDTRVSGVHIRLGHVPDASVRDDVTPRLETVALEPYVARVVAAEAAPGMPAAALEAVAIAARTFAVTHRTRHQDEAFELCDTTHCQAVATAAWSAAYAAASATRGLVLAREGHPVPIQYSAACPGTLYAARDVWGGDVAAHEDVRSHVGAEPNRHDVATWQADVRVEELTRALHAAGLRGGPPRDVSVARTASGLPLAVRLDGMQPDVLSADRFRTIVGRALGWHVLKSHYWTVDRRSGGYHFRGQGKGHGVGLCLAGAETMARRDAGTTASDVLAVYYARLGLRSLADTVRLRVSTRSEGRAPELLALAYRLLADLRATLRVAAARDVEIVEHTSIEAYQRTTGRAWWTSATTRMVAPTRARIDVVPFETLRRRGRVEAVLRHELVHVLTEATLGDAPLWVREGLATLAATGDLPKAAPGTHHVPSRQPPSGDWSADCPRDAELMSPGGGDIMRDLYLRAAHCVARHLETGASWRAAR